MAERRKKKDTEKHCLSGKGTYQNRRDGNDMKSATTSESLQQGGKGVDFSCDGGNIESAENLADAMRERTGTVSAKFPVLDWSPADSSGQAKRRGRTAGVKKRHLIDSYGHSRKH